MFFCTDKYTSFKSSTPSVSLTISLISSLKLKLSHLQQAYLSCYLTFFIYLLLLLACHSENLSLRQRPQACCRMTGLRSPSGTSSCLAASASGCDLRFFAWLVRAWEYTCFWLHGPGVSSSLFLRPSYIHLSRRARRIQLSPGIYACSTLLLGLFLRRSFTCPTASDFAIISSLPPSLHTYVLSHRRPSPLHHDVV